MMCVPFVVVVIVCLLLLLCLPASFVPFAHIMPTQNALVSYDFYRQVAATIPHLACATPVLPIRTLQTAVVSKISFAAAYGPLMWRNCIEYLHDTGVLICDRNFENACLIPEAIFSFLSLAESLQRKHKLSAIVYADQLATLNSVKGHLPGDMDWTITKLKSLLDWLRVWDITDRLTEREEQATKLGITHGFYVPPLRKMAELDFALPAQRNGVYLGSRFKFMDCFSLSEVYFNMQVSV